MIQLKIYNPLPSLFGIVDDPQSLTIYIKYKEGISIEDIFNTLAGKHEKFNDILKNEEDILLNQLVISVNRKILGGLKERKTPLEDDSTIMFLPPFAGG